MSPPTFRDRQRVAFARHNCPPLQIEPASWHRHSGPEAPCRSITRLKRLTSSNVLEKTDRDANIRNTLFIASITDTPRQLSYTYACETVANQITSAIAAEMIAVNLHAAERDLGIAPPPAPSTPTSALPSPASDRRTAEIPARSTDPSETRRSVPMTAGCRRCIETDKFSRHRR